MVHFQEIVVAMSHDKLFRANMLSRGTNFQLLCILCSLKLFASYISINCISGMRSTRLQVTDFPDLEKCLIREYASFFNPMEKSFYDEGVRFLDPLTKLTGIDAYMNNVNMLSGRTFLGSLLFEDAKIALHNIRQLDSRKLQTRWTLQVTAKALPWKPRAQFSGISVYSLNTDGTKIIQQEDYWDSINLKNGEYSFVSFSEGLSDFLGQLSKEFNAEMAAPEWPYELLRRAKRYVVRRYPASVVADTTYEQRPQGYDRLGSYATGSNEKNAKISYFSPTLMQVSGKDGNRIKRMAWPLEYETPSKPLSSPSSFPVPTIPSIRISTTPSRVVAISRFEVAATEPVVRGFTEQLRRDVVADRLVPATSTEDAFSIAQYDALFSLNKRRNEVWLELSEHPW